MRFASLLPSLGTRVHRRLRSLRPLIPASALAALVFGGEREALAQQKGFALDRFDPSDRGSEWFVGDSLDLRGHLRPSAGGVIGSWAYKPLVAYDISGKEQATLVEHQIYVHPGGSLVLFNRARVALSLPIAVYQTGDSVTVKTTTYEPPKSAIGDLRLASDVRIFGEHGKLLTGAAGFALYLPTGSRDNYTSDGTVRFSPRASLAGDFHLLTYTARGGWAYRPLDEKFERNPLGSEVFLSGALGARTLKGKLVIGPEVFASSILDRRSFLRRRGTSVEWLFGTHYTVSELRFGAGVGTGLTRGWGTPTLRAFLSAEWTPGVSDDADHDGIKNAEDACPNTPGIRTSDPKTNGCPDATKVIPSPSAADTDRDGIPDKVDACPNLAGVADPNPKRNGCPPDRDGDGIFDMVDACPDVPGIPSNTPAKNGCPKDQDGDGIPDDVDACPDVPGVPSSDKLSNGCPADRDGDGVADNEDACPDAPGPADPDPKHNGCPLARIEDGQIKIVDQVRFKVDSADILRDSDPTLLAVATTLKAHPEIAKIRIEGHTDNQGRAQHNHELSYRRAAAVEKWLVSYGLPKSLFEAKGYGPNRPLDSNSTEEGRQNNRRVEFHIVTIVRSPTLKR